MDQPRMAWNVGLPGRPLAFTGRSGHVLVLRDQALLSINVRDFREEVLCQALPGVTRWIAAFALTPQQVVLCDDQGLLWALESAGVRPLKLPPGFRVGGPDARLALSPSGRFLAAGGFVGAGFDRTWRLAFFELHAPDREPWLIDDETVRGVRWWDGDLAVVEAGKSCDPNQRRVLATAAPCPPGRVSPAGTSGVTLTQHQLVVARAAGERAFDVRLDSRDALEWVDERTLVHAAPPYLFIDTVTGDVCRHLDPDRGEDSLLLSADGRRVASPARRLLGDLLLHEPPAPGFPPTELLAPAVRLERAELERLVMELAGRLVAWGLELRPTVHWGQAPDEDALGWTRPLAKRLDAAHRQRDGHRDVFGALGPVSEVLRRRSSTDAELAELLLAEGTYRSAVAFDLQVDGARVAELPNPFEPLLHLARAGALVTEVGPRGLLLAPRP